MADREERFTFHVGAFGIDSGKTVKTEFGAYASISYIKKIGTASAYTGRLDFFSNYLHDPQNIDIYWTNMLAVKVAKLLSMTLSVNIIYDNDVRFHQIGWDQRWT